MFTQPRVLSQQTCSIHLDTHFKKRFTIIKSNGQCKQISVKNTLSKKALLGWIENALQVSEKMWREPIESMAKTRGQSKMCKVIIIWPCVGGDDGFKGLDLYMYKCGGILYSM
jgi:hypothetical protein